MKFFAKCILTSLVASIGITSMQTLADDKPFQWPKKYKAAVNLSYDDALDSQLNNAIPALKKYKFHGTFYLPLGADTLRTRLPEWRAAAKNGHELANHSLFHQCSKTGPGREWVKEEDNLDNVSVAQMRKQVMLGNTMLHAIDGKTERTFTAPCIDQKAGGENYIDSIKSEFVAIKDAGGTGVIADMKTLDPYYVAVTFPNNITGDQLIALVKEAGEKGTMVNFTFHGVGGDHIVTSVEAHEQLLKFLAAHRDEYWTDTFVNIMTYVKAHQ